MRERTKKLSFFDDVMAMDFAPTFFHPVALVGAMSRDCQLKRKQTIFDIEDAKIGLKYIYDTYGKYITRIVERIYRLETANFTSEQYQYGATPGMERHGKAPYYGWDAERFVIPPLGTWSSLEGEGLSVIGGTKPNLKTKKDFLILDSVTNAMIYLAEYIKHFKGDYARWYRLDEEGKAKYRLRVEDKYLRQRIYDSLEAGTLVIKPKPHIEDECEEEIEKVEDVSGDWHEPVDNPMSTNYMQSGGGGLLGKHWGLFGKTRKGSNHTGLDLFSIQGSNIYACVSGIVYKRGWHGGYGNTITIKVDNPSFFKKNRLNYQLKYKKYGEEMEGKSFTRHKDIYLFYAHLDEVNEFKIGDKIKLGDILGKTGRSGITEGTTAPHLHFEIFSKYQMLVGTNNKINPAYFVDYKVYDDQSDEERTMQITEKDKGKKIAYSGKKKLHQI